MNVDVFFTGITDKVTETLGKWWFTTLSFLLLLGWIAYGVFAIGSGWFQSTQWGLSFNAITSGAEFFFELWILAAANRVERRNIALLETIERLAEKIEAQEAKEIAELTQIEQGLGVEASE